MRSIINIQSEVRQEFMSTSLSKPECASSERPRKIEDIMHDDTACAVYLVTRPRLLCLQSGYTKNPSAIDRGRVNTLNALLPRSFILTRAAWTETGQEGRKEATFLVRGGRAQALACSAILWLTNGVQI